MPQQPTRRNAAKLQREQVLQQSKKMAPASSSSKRSNPKARVPTEKPAFTIKDLRRAIPKHCFQRSLVMSFGYLFWDLTLIAIMFAACLHIETGLSNEVVGQTFGPFVRTAAWAVYWYCQGAVMTGLWVIGHECGHGGFADSELINNVTGWIVHSALLVPFFSWKISHRRHHSNTGSLEHDEVFVPAHSDIPRDQLPQDDHEDDSTIHHVMDSIKRLINMVMMFTIGWPLYLAINATGNQSYAKGAWVNHFMPSSPIFQAKEGNLILLSDLGVALALGALYKAATLSSFGWVVYTFVIPYLITNFWLVFITFNQHTTEALPHYNKTEWDWLRGALATVDRDYGLLNYVFHHIADTHVTHHIFSGMPHYHAEEATEALKKVLGDYYKFDNTPIFKACWNNFKLNTCRPDSAETSGIMWFTPAE